MVREWRLRLTVLGIFLIIVGGSIPLLRSWASSATPYVKNATDEIGKIAKPTKQPQQEQPKQVGPIEAVGTWIKEAPERARERGMPQPAPVVASPPLAPAKPEPKRWFRNECGPAGPNSYQITLGQYKYTPECFRLTYGQSAVFYFDNGLPPSFEAHIVYPMRSSGRVFRWQKIIHKAGQELDTTQFNELRDMQSRYPSNPIEVSVSEDDLNRMGDIKFRIEVINRLPNAPDVVPPAPAVTPTAIAESKPAFQNQEHEITLPANIRWMDTRVSVQAGAMLSFTATGQAHPCIRGTVHTCADRIYDSWVGPRGFDKENIPRGLIMSNTPLMGLLGRVGNGSPFYIGDKATVTASASGRLYLTVNDSNFSDNQGTFTVQLQISQ